MLFVLAVGGWTHLKASPELVIGNERPEEMMLKYRPDNRGEPKITEAYASVRY